MDFIPSYAREELGFNQKVWTRHEFDECCKYFEIKVFLFTEARGRLKLSPYNFTEGNLEGISLPICDTPFHGAYGPITDKSGVKHQVIILDGNLRGTKFLITGLHELGHFFHKPSTSDFHMMRFTEGFLCDLTMRAEYRAHVVPVCALLPKPILESMTPREIQKEYGYLPKWIAFRQRLAEKYNI